MKGDGLRVVRGTSALEYIVCFVATSQSMYRTVYDSV